MNIQPFNYTYDNTITNFAVLVILSSVSFPVFQFQFKLKPLARVSPQTFTLINPFTFPNALTYCQNRRL